MDKPVFVQLRKGGRWHIKHEFRGGRVVALCSATTMQSNAMLDTPGHVPPQIRCCDICLRRGEINPALTDRAIALVNGCLARVTAEQGYRIGAAHSECILARMEPQEDLFRSAALADTFFEAQLLAREWIEDRKEEGR